tara:strand:+ start:96 stop:353 length:258 start_codon:yes stop_codon:yes gene_type:complete
MIQDTQEYLQQWEKENNPFYPSEMRWDRLQVNRFLKDYKQQLALTDVSQQRELLIDFCTKLELKAKQYSYLIPDEDFIDEYLKDN